MPSQRSGNRVTQAHVRFLALWDPTFLRTISHSCVSVPGTVLAWLNRGRPLPSAG